MLPFQYPADRASQLSVQAALIQQTAASGLVQAPSLARKPRKPAPFQSKGQSNHADPGSTNMSTKLGAGRSQSEDPLTGIQLRVAAGHVGAFRISAILRPPVGPCFAGTFLGGVQREAEGHPHFRSDLQPATTCPSSKRQAVPPGLGSSRSPPRCRRTGGRTSRPAADFELWAPKSNLRGRVFHGKENREPDAIETPIGPCNLFS